MSQRVMFEAQGIDVFYGASQILFDVSLAVAEGQTMALLGRNGAGKSTTLKVLAGVLPATAGRVRVAGIDAASDPAEVRAREATERARALEKMVADARKDLSLLLEYVTA